MAKRKDTGRKAVERGRRIRSVGYDDPRFVVSFYDVIAGARRELDNRMPVVVVGYGFQRDGEPERDGPAVEVYASHSGKLTDELLVLAQARMKELTYQESTDGKGPLPAEEVREQAPAEREGQPVRG